MSHGHRTAELRSLEYHRLIAERLRRDPEVLRRAHDRVTGWLDTCGPVDPRWAKVWHELLALAPEEVASRITADDEAGRALRQTSPFAGELSPRERWRIVREVGRRERVSSGAPTSST